MMVIRMKNPTTTPRSSVRGYACSPVKAYRNASTAYVSGLISTSAFIQPGSEVTGKSAPLRKESGKARKTTTT